MKCQILFHGKKEKSLNSLSAEFAQGMVKVKQKVYIVIFCNCLSLGHSSATVFEH